VYLWLHDRNALGGLKLSVESYEKVLVVRVVKGAEKGLGFEV